MIIQKWYEINNPESIDSPALLVFENRVKYNIEQMIKIAGNPLRLMPHVKTHKMSEIAQMQILEGIHQFKCATIAEADMLAKTGASHILLAYQLNGPKIIRFLDLIENFPDIKFSSLVDNFESAKSLNKLAGERGINIDVYIDVDSGMHRTGISPDDNLIELYIQMQDLKNLQVIGLHIYDGHIAIEDYEKRKVICKNEFESVNKVVVEITEMGYPLMKLVVGGSPTFNIHAANQQVNCSPGTSVLWDYGYHLLLPEQPFIFAAVLLTRVISKPKRNFITLDLGYKAVASENVLSKRIYFLNLTEHKIHSQSEEHLVIQIKDWSNIHIGDVIYGVPYHVCPTIALFEEAVVIQNGNVVDKWNITARRRKITF